MKPNHVECDKAPPLILALIIRRVRCVELMVKAEWNVNERWHGQYPLHIAAKHNTSSLVKLLLAAGANPNQPNQWGNTPTTEACRCDNEKALAALLDGGGKVTPNPPVVKKRESIWTPYAASKELEEDETLLNICAGMGSLNCLKHLVQVWDVSESEIQVATYEAIRSLNSKCVSYLVMSVGCDVEKPMMGFDEKHRFYGKSLAQVVYGNNCLNPRCEEWMDSLIQVKLLVFVMGRHGRVGAGSIVGILKFDLLDEIAGFI